MVKLVHGQPVHQTLERELTLAARNRHRCHHLSSNQDGVKGNDNHDMEYNDEGCFQTNITRNIKYEISPTNHLE